MRKGGTPTGATGADPLALVEERGSHLLVTCHGRFAVLERRNGRVYAARSARRRQGFPDTPEGMRAAIGEDWRDEREARRFLDEIARRGETLARRLW